MQNGSSLSQSTSEFQSLADSKVIKSINNSGMESKHEEDIHITVSLPPLAANSNRLSSVQRTSLRLQKTSSSKNPGSAMRLSNTPPIPPPRPENTISPWTRDLPTSRVEVTPLMSSLPPVAPLATPVAASNNIRLTSPRPGNFRSENLYVDAPVKTASSSGKCALLKTERPQSLPSTHRPLPPSQSVITSKSYTPSLAKEKAPKLSDPFLLSGGQANNRFSVSGSSFSLESSEEAETDSIICRNCGKCRCLACRTPKKLPEKWMCGNKCRLSAESVVDFLSCLCLVKGVFYHFGKDREESNQSKSGFDSPCSCSAENSCFRWTCLGLSSLILPCLCCYWPLKGCTKGAEKVYRRLKANGCRCEHEQQPSSSVLSQTSSRRSSSEVIKGQPFSTSSPIFDPSKGKK